MKIENPNSIIKISFDGFLSCLKIEKPRVVDWPDHGGSVGRYFACMPQFEYENELLKDIEGRFSSLKTVQDLLESGIVDLLETGEYEFELWENVHTELLFNNDLLNSNEIMYNWRKEQVGTHRVGMPFTVNCFYPYGRQLMFTQPFESLDHKRIKYYEEKITNGERPIAISIRVKNNQQPDEESYQDTMYNTTKYILDGHHKLVAYQNLKINPSYFVISRVNNGLQETFDDSALPILDNYLFYYQIEHIVNNGIEIIKKTPKLTKRIDDFLKSVSRVEDTFVKNLHRNAFDSKYKTNSIERKWYLDRLNVLIDQVNNQKSDFHLDYWCTDDCRRKYLKVENWEDLIAVFKNALRY